MRDSRRVERGKWLEIVCGIDEVIYLTIIKNASIDTMLVLGIEPSVHRLFSFPYQGSRSESE